jgi:hypothetical protein
VDDAIATYFQEKPQSYEVFEAVHDRVSTFGPFEVSVASQISFGVNRKFAWFWLYNVTKRNPNGVPHIMLLMEERFDDPRVRNIEQVSKNRWNHQIVLQSLEDASSEWLGPLLHAAYNLGSR